MPKFSKQSLKHYDTLDPRLQLILDEVIEMYDITIICGHRNKEDQNAAFDSGHSALKWPNSKHNSLPSMAVDIAPYPIDWENLNRFHWLAGMMFAVADSHNIKLLWGGNFSSIFDGPHFEISDND